jgi:hypothetical protein
MRKRRPDTPPSDPRPDRWSGRKTLLVIIIASVVLWIVIFGLTR